MLPVSTYLSHLKRFISGHGGQGFWSVGENLAYPFMMILATPLYLSSLGTNQYGQWMLLVTFNSMGGLVGLGMGSATIKEVSAYRASSDNAGAAAAVRSSLTVTLVSSFAVSLLFVVGGYFAGPSLLAKIGDAETVHFIILTAAALVSLEQIDMVFAGAIRGCERFDLVARIEMLCKFTIVVVTLIVAWLTKNLHIVFAAIIFLTAVRALIKAVFAGRLLEHGRLWPSWNRGHVARAFDFGKWTWVQSIGAVAFSTADRLIIGSTLGAPALAGYSICLQLAQQVQAIPAAGAYVLFPLVSRKNAQRENIKSTAMKSLVLLCFFASAIALPLFVFGGEILRLWVGPTLAAYSDEVLRVLVVSFALLALNNVPHYVLLGLNKSRIVAQVNIAAGLISIAICWWGTPHFGLLAAALGRLAYALVICLLFYVMFRKLNHSHLKT